LKPRQVFSAQVGCAAPPSLHSASVLQTCGRVVIAPTAQLSWQLVATSPVRVRQHFWWSVPLAGQSACSSQLSCNVFWSEELSHEPDWLLWMQTLSVPPSRAQQKYVVLPDPGPASHSEAPHVI